jgi:Glycosyl hydrolases family 39
VLAGTTLSACTGDSAEPAAIPGPAVALQDDFLALPDKPPEARIALLAETGAKVARFDIVWQFVAPVEPVNPSDPADPAYKFDHVDAVVRGLKKRGIIPIVSVFNAPEWATGGRADEDVITAYNSRMPDAEAYGAFMEALSRRYSGKFDASDGARLPRVRHWEVWNEPNLNIFLSPQLDDEGHPVSPQNYASLVRAAYPRIKRGGGDDTVVIVGVAGPRGRTNKSGVGVETWLRELRRMDVPLDAYSQHIYPAAAPTVETDVKPSWSTVDDLLAELEAWQPGLELYITEAGYTTQATPFRKTAVSEEQQAEYLRQIFDLPQVQDPRVRAIVWFNMQDNPNWPAGLMREDESRKPSWDVFREVAKRPGQRSLDEPVQK